MCLKLILRYIVQYFKKMDKQLLIAVILCSAFSVLILYSIVQNGVATGDRVSPRTYKMQLLMSCAGACVALVLSALDYHKFIKLWFLFGPGSLILCLLLFTPLGVKAEGGADDIGWLNLCVRFRKRHEVIRRIVRLDEGTDSLELASEIKRIARREQI